MSWLQSAEPRCTTNAGGVSLTIEPRERDLVGFSVRRVLPARERRMVGPFLSAFEIPPRRLCIVRAAADAASPLDRWRARRCAA